MHLSGEFRSAGAPHSLKPRSLRQTFARAGFSLYSYGKFWTMDDCLYRNREQGNQWTLLVDIDEVASLPGVPGGLRGLADRLEADGFESTNFHSVGYLSSYCGDAPAAAANGSRSGLSERIIFRAIYPEQCDDIHQRECMFDNLLAIGGRRKVGRGGGSRGMSSTDDLVLLRAVLSRPGATRSWMGLMSGSLPFPALRDRGRRRRRCSSSQRRR